MRVEVDGLGITTAATRLRDQAELLRQQRRACLRVPDGLTDPRLRNGATALSDLAADVFELVAMDVELLATKMRASVAGYADVEQGVRDRMAAGG